MSWLRQVFRHSRPKWLRVAFRYDWSPVVRYHRVTRVARAARLALVAQRGAGTEAWLEGSDDLGQTWRKCGDDGALEEA